MFSFNNKTPKKINFCGKHVKELIFNGISVWKEGVLALISGKPPLELPFSVGNDLVDYKVYGESIQATTPAPDAPVEIECVGDYDEANGKYKVPIKISGKNLVDSLNIQRRQSNITNISYEDGIYIGTGNVGLEATAHSAGDLTLLLGKIYEANKTYTFSIPITLLEQGVYDNRTIIYIGDEAQFARYYKYFNLSIEETVLKYTLTPTMDIDRIVIRFNNNKLRVNVGKIQMEEGSVQTDFEPYFEPVTTDINLNEPLRKIGTYADYIDFKNQQVVRNIGIARLTNSASIAKYSGGKYSFQIPVNLSAMYNENWTTVKNEYLKATSLITLYRNRDKSGYNVIAQGGAGSICVMVNDYTTLTEFKAWLNENPLTVHYVLETPKIEDIELPSIATGEGTNVIDVGTTLQPSNVEIEYYKTI